MGGWKASFFEGFHDNLGEVLRLEFLRRTRVAVVVHQDGVFHVLFFWLRATFPRYRYDQIMRLGWKVFIPVTIIWIAVEGVMAWFEIGPWKGLTG